MRRLLPDSLGPFRFYLVLAIVAVIVWDQLQIPIDDPIGDRLLHGIPTANADGLASRDEIIADLLWCKTHALIDQLPDYALSAFPPGGGEVVAGSASSEESDPCSSTTHPPSQPPPATTRPASPNLSIVIPEER